MAFLYRMLGLGLILATPAASWAQEDPVLLTIGDHKLTLSTIQKELKTSPSAEQPAWESLPQDVRLNILQGISRQFLLQEAAAKEIKADDPRIEERLTKMRDQIRIQLYTEETLNDLVSDRDIEKAAKEAVREERQYRYQLMQLLAKDLETVQKGAELLKADKGLGAIEAEVPGISASDLGWVDEDALFPPIAQAVKPLSKGDVSTPIQTPFGWHVLLLLKKEMAPEEEIDGILPDVRETLRREAWNKHVHKLYDKADVTYIDSAGKSKPLPW